MKLYVAIGVTVGIEFLKGGSIRTCSLVNGGKQVAIIPNEPRQVAIAAVERICGII